MRCWFHCRDCSREECQIESCESCANSQLLQISDPFPCLSVFQPPELKIDISRILCYMSGTQMQQRWQSHHKTFPKSQDEALWFFEQREYNICSGACGLPELGSNCYISLTEQGETWPSVFVISEVCGAILLARQHQSMEERRGRCLDICCQSKSDTARERKKQAKTFPPTICRLWSVLKSVINLMSI